MKKINMNKFAVKIAAREGKKKNLNIGQIKEVIRCVFEELNTNHSASEIMEVVERY